MAQAWGFDTESKPTFKVGEVSDGPHILQLATAERAWVIQLHDPECRAVAAGLLGGIGLAVMCLGLLALLTVGAGYLALLVMGQLFLVDFRFWVVAVTTRSWAAAVMTSSTATTG